MESQNLLKKPFHLFDKSSKKSLNPEQRIANVGSCVQTMKIKRKKDRLRSWSILLSRNLFVNINPELASIGCGSKMVFDESMNCIVIMLEFNGNLSISSSQ